MKSKDKKDLKLKLNNKIKKKSKKVKISKETILEMIQKYIKQIPQQYSEQYGEELKNIIQESEKTKFSTNDLIVLANDFVTKKYGFLFKSFVMSKIEKIIKENFE